ncbi:NAD(P)-binding protein [Dentipellis sp. KUC8613]|nr:NAD(P)-binding protein [Dentipellis sp. KUC8613]
MIVLTGTTGGLGSQVLKHLLPLVPASQITVSLYNPTLANTAGFPAGVTVRRGDFGDPASLDAAFAGAERLLIVSYPSIAHELRVRHHVNAIDAAKRAGVKHIYYTSLAFADDSVSEVMQAHLDTQKYLKESGVTYTIIREGIYEESYPLYFGFFDKSKTDLYVPGDGPIAWVSREDLGEGTARIIAGGGFENQTVLLSGSASSNLTLQQLSTTISRILAHPVNLHVVSVDEYVAKNKSPNPDDPRGSEDFLRKWAKTFDAMRRGETARVDPLLQELLGRPLRSMEAYLEKTLGSLSDAEKEALEQYAK